MRKEKVYKNMSLFFAFCTVLVGIYSMITKLNPGPTIILMLATLTFLALYKNKKEDGNGEK